MDDSDGGRAETGTTPDTTDGESDGDSDDARAKRESQATDDSGEHPLAGEATALESQAEQLERLGARMDDVRESMADIGERLASYEVSETDHEGPRSDTERGADGLPDEPPADGVEEVIDRLERLETSVDTDADTGADAHENADDATKDQ